jgi:histidine triad (HIT) family protein
MILRRPQVTDCLFCRIVAKEVPAKEVYRDEEVVAFHDIDPKAPTHILIIPVKHIGNVGELEEGDLEVIGKLMLKARDLAREQGIADSGFRLVTNTGDEGGQEVPHLHLHLAGGARLGRWW